MRTARWLSAGALPAGGMISPVGGHVGLAESDVTAELVGGQLVAVDEVVHLTGCTPSCRAASRVSSIGKPSDSMHLMVLHSNGERPRGRMTSE